MPSQPAHASGSYWQRLLSQQVPGLSLAAFRFCFGTVLVCHILKYLWPTDHGTLAQYLYVDTAFNFRYLGFEWVTPWSEPWLTVHFVVVGVAALFVALGLYYRLAICTLFLGYTYIFLLEAIHYNNHYYLICLVSFLMIWMPAANCVSLDAWRRRRKQKLQSDNNTIPFWPVFLLRAQLFIMYFYAGIAKINADWLSGDPLRSPGQDLIDLMSKVGIPQFLPLDQFCRVIAWSGLVFDLSIGFMLIARRTRVLALGLVFLFHFHNYLIFPIGIFPAMAFTATLIFCDTDWPKTFLNWLKSPRIRRPDWGWLFSGAFTLPVVGGLLGWKNAASETPRKFTTQSRNALVSWLVLFWLSSQALLPFRHFFIAGDANWTEEGQDFSWRMMLRAKAVGYVMYDIHDSELIVTDDRKRDQIDWNKWPDKNSKAIHVPVDCQLFRWSAHPGMTVVYEPALGRRVIFNPIRTLAGRDEELDRTRRMIQATWEAQLGRHTEIFETIGIDRAIARSIDELRKDAKENSQKQQLIERLQSFVQNLADTDSSESMRELESRQIQLVDAIRDTLLLAPDTNKWWRRLHPFVLQGAEAPLQPLLVIVDKTPLSNEELLQLSNGEPYLVWMDLSRMRPEGWNQLPQILACYDRGALKIVWNYFLELTPLQREKFAAKPFLIRQYAGHIGDRWQAMTGRNCKVAASSFVMLNYKLPQALVDPRVDLTSVDYSIFRHNPWILPLRGERPHVQQATHESSSIIR